MNLTVTNHDGVAHDLDTASGAALMRLISDAWLEEIFGIFGGASSPASCHVVIDEDFFGQLGKTSGKTGDLHYGSNFPLCAQRLSYKIIVNQALDGLRITIAREDGQLN